MEMDTTGGGLALRTPLSFPSNYDEFASPYHEIGIIKLTAMFVARYGVRICRELTKKVDTRAVLKFMEPSDGRFHLYEMAVDAYSKVLKDSDADTETVIERYFQCLQWEEEQKTLDDLVPLGLRFVFQRVDGRKVIEITVESWLLEKVASLKEKIGKMIQMQAKELKLRRKAGGVLKEDKSLAHNNVEAGEILTPTDLAHFKVELGRCKS
ncbi:hypothetical protein Bca4012_050521 [Brassica carinata]